VPDPAIPAQRSRHNQQCEPDNATLAFLSSTFALRSSGIAATHSGARLFRPRFRCGQKQFGLPESKVLGEAAKLELRGNSSTPSTTQLQPIGFGTDQARIENPKFGQTPGGMAGRVIEFKRVLVSNRASVRICGAEVQETQWNPAFCMADCASGFFHEVFHTNCVRWFSAMSMVIPRSMPRHPRHTSR